MRKLSILVEKQCQSYTYIIAACMQPEVKQIMKKTSIAIITAMFCVIGVFGGKSTLAQEKTLHQAVSTQLGQNTLKKTTTLTGLRREESTQFSAEEPAMTPTVEPTIVPAEEPTQMPEESPTPEPTEEPHIAVLKKVTGVEAVRYSTNAVKITWKKHKKAKYYRVYYSIKGQGKYRLAGVTKDTHFLVTKLKNRKTYSFYVKACKNKKESASDSMASQKVSMKMKKYTRKIIFAGDSICEGIGYGQAFPKMHSSAIKKTVAYRGLNTITYHTKRIFNGKTGLQKLISEKPYRVYMMLGLNEIHGRKADLVIAEYKDLVRAVQQGTPNTDIVLCAISPVTRGERARKPGMWQIPLFNRKLKKLAKKLGVRYFDYTAFLKDSGGYLKAQYAARDGYHWKPEAYVKYGEIIGKYDKSLDR